MIQLTNITKTYQTSEIETTALNELSITINEGEFVSIMGTSGCGKSTLLNIIGMLDDTNSGSYLFEGKEITQMSEAERTQMRK